MSDKHATPAVTTDLNILLGSRFDALTEAQVVEAMAFGGAPVADICDYIGKKPSEVNRAYGRIIKKQRSHRRTRLRQAQIAWALKGNAALLIWTGKQYLGQRDQPVFQDARATNEQARDMHKLLMAMDARSAPAAPAVLLPPGETVPGPAHG